MKAMILSASPRRDGNSAALAGAAAEGLRASGHDVTRVHADDILGGFLRDCRSCRRPDGECAIDDHYRRAFFETFLPADGFIAATPVYWYGMSAQLKAFFDRSFCYYAASYPRAVEVRNVMQGKRIGVLMSSEETFPTADAGILHTLQEYSRYTHSTFVGAVRGIGNARGEIVNDPGDPVGHARRFGATFFDAHASDYTIEAGRSPRVWG